jgi:DivIVA domain-containing protein
MPLTPEDVANKQFTSTRLKPGYDETEVDEFLDEVEAELTRLYRENDELRSKVAAAGRGAPEAVPVAAQAQAPAAVDPNPALARENDELRQKLAATQRQLSEAANRPAAQAPPAQAAPQAAPPQAAPSETATGILALAQRTADEHIAEARTQADRIIGEARTRAEQLKREADDKHRQMIGSLETERSTLEREVEKLRSFEREYRSRLKNYLEGQLRELDGSSTSAPAVQGGGGQGGQPPQGQPPQGQPTGQGAPARSPFAPGAPVGGDAPSGPPQQPQGFGDGDQRG